MINTFSIDCCSWELFFVEKSIGIKTYNLYPANIDVILIATKNYYSWVY